MGLGVGGLLVSLGWGFVVAGWRSVVVGVAGVVLVASGCGSSVSRGAGDVAADPLSVGALSQGVAGDGDVVPVFEGARLVVSPQVNLVSTSVVPVLDATAQEGKRGKRGKGRRGERGRVGSGGWSFVVTDLSSDGGGFRREGSSDSSVFRVPGDWLRDGFAYSWWAVDPAGNESAKSVFTVDTERVSAQAADSMAGVGVSLSSGVVHVTSQTHQMNSASGGVGVGFDYQPGNDPWPGMPVNWRLVTPSAAQWDRLVFSGAAVNVHSKNGSWVNYVDAGAGVFNPVWNRAGDLAPTGMFASLVRNEDGSFTLTDTDQTVVTFGVPNEEGTSWVSSVSAGGQDSLQESYDDEGRLEKLTDPVSGRSVELSYGGGKCGDTGSGFVDAPDGLLCRVLFWDGTETWLNYVETPAGVQLGRIADNPQAGGSGASVTDYAYDQVGRLARVRAPLTTAAQAAGVTGDADEAQLTTTVQYDTSGRVFKVVAPAAQVGGEQMARRYSFDYDSFRTTVAGFSVRGGETVTNLGVLSQVTYDPNTFNVLESAGADGLAAQFEWHQQNPDLLLKSTNPSGGVMTYEYDASQQLVSQQGPTVGGVSGGSPTLEYDYDRDYSVNSEKGLPFQGLNFQIWDNETWTGAPAASQLGPRTPEGTLAPVLDMAWSEAPGGVGGPWSGRMTGRFTLPDPADEDNPDTYTITFDSATVWIDNVQCPPEGCIDMPLTGGEHNIRIDLTFDDNGGQFIVRAGKNGDQPRPIDTTQLTPGYGARTEARALDQLAGKADFSHTRFAYTNPTLGEVNRVWNQAGLVTWTGYEDGAHGRLGRPVSVVLPAGNVTGFEYWGDTENANECGSGRVSQGGLPKVTVAPDPVSGEADGIRSTQWYTESGAVAGQQYADGELMCFEYDDAGRVSRQSQGDVVAEFVYAAGGNPLVQEVRQSTSVGEKTARVESDLLGRPVKVVDVWGSEQVLEYEAATGKPVKSTTTVNPGSAGAYQVVTSSEYDDAGYLVGQQTRDNRGSDPVTAKLTYSEDGQLASAEYSNGSRSRYDYDGNQRMFRVYWWDADSQRWASKFDYAPSGRVLAGKLIDPKNNQSTFSYTYDDAARLQNVGLDTNVKDVASSWVYEYDQNSNRTKQTVDGQSWTYEYDRADRLVSTTDPMFEGGFEYDDAGSMTRMGALSLTYNDATQISKITDDAKNLTIEYLRDANNNLVGKVTTAGDQVTTTRYSLAGTLLNENNQPYLRVQQLPGGPVVSTIVPAPASADEPVNRDAAEADTDTVQETPEPGVDEPTPRPDPADQPTGQPTEDPGDQPTQEATDQPADPGTPEPAPSEDAEPADEATPAVATRWDYPAINTNTLWSADENGKTLNTEAYLFDAFGTPLNPPPAVNPAQPAFTAQGGIGITTETDLTIPVMPMGQRLYVPALGRFTTTDPVQGGSANNYDYANQDPINNNDPTGQSARGWWKALQAAIITVVAVTAGALTGGLADGPIAAFAIGAAAGAAVGAVGYTVTHMGPHSDWSWGGFTSSVLGGALAGGFAGRSNYAKRVALGAARATETQAAQKVAASGQKEMEKGLFTITEEVGEQEAVYESTAPGAKLAADKAAQMSSPTSKVVQKSVGKASNSPLFKNRLAKSSTYVNSKWLDEAAGPFGDGLPGFP